MKERGRAREDFGKKRNERKRGEKKRNKKQRGKRTERGKRR